MFLIFRLNYLHGTGHGVGSYLNVHEYPVMISWKEYPDDPGMQANVFVSNGEEIDIRNDCSK